MTAFVEVSYRGLRVAQKAKLTATDNGAFVEHETPLPVGSPLQVLEDGQPARAARVVRVVEHEAGAGPAGMRLVWVSAESLARPAPVNPAAPAPEVAAPAPEVAAPAPETAASAPETAAPEAAVPEAVSVETSGDTSEDGDRSSDGSVDRSSDGAVSGGNGKKSKKNKKRR